jgi:CxxC-x17-CxxC domain-containing protein
MNTYNKNRGGGSGGRGGYQGRDGGRNDRGGRGGRDFGGPKTMHKAKCSDCGNIAEVPFKPTGEKPVFCSDCFSQQRDGGDRRDNDRGDFRKNDRRDHDRGDFRNNDRGGEKRDFATRTLDPAAGAMKKLQKEVDTLNMKMDKVLSLLSSKGSMKKESNLSEVMASIEEVAEKKSTVTQNPAHKKTTPKKETISPVKKPSGRKAAALKKEQKKAAPKKVQPKATAKKAKVAPKKKK